MIFLSSNKIKNCQKINKNKEKVEIISFQKPPPAEHEIYELLPCSSPCLFPLSLPLCKALFNNSRFCFQTKPCLHHFHDSDSADSYSSSKKNHVAYSTSIPTAATAGGDTTRLHYPLRKRVRGSTHCGSRRDHSTRSHCRRGREALLRQGGHGCRPLRLRGVG